MRRYINKEPVDTRKFDREIGEDVTEVREGMRRVWRTGFVWRGDE
jgi:hypothetical protein